MAWVSQRDGGQSDAINQGLRRATGQIVSYINSDDGYLPGAFQEVAARSPPTRARTSCLATAT